MSRVRVVTGLVAVAAAGSLFLSGCSSSKSGGGTSSAPAGGGASTPSAPAVSSPVVPISTPAAASGSSTGAADAASLVPAAIKSKGTLTIATDATYPPDESVAADGHTIVGMDADLGTDLGKVLGLKVNIVNATFDTIIPGLQDGKFDVGLSSFTDTKEREKVVDFVTYFQAGEGFYVKAGSGKKYDGLDSLCGANVAVESGTTEQTDAQSQSKKCATAGKGKVTVLSFSDQNAANLAVSSGRADVGFVDSQIAGFIVSQSHGQFTVTGTAFEVAPYGIALPKGNGMAPAVLAGLKQMMADGSYAALLKKWGVQGGAITNPVINGAIS